MMWYALALFCLVIYLICSLWFLVGNIAQMHLLWHAGRKKRSVTNNNLREEHPKVTIQVPVYNERYVITRLLNALGNLDYPAHCFDIQVLDDSTDDTSELIDHASQQLKKKGIQVSIVRRSERRGYKAGALQAAMPLCKGELIAIFDADFIPNPDFLSRTVGYFSDPQVGGVQGRWLHENLEENTLTRIQAFLLDSHFQLEQKGRSAAGYFLNFNGTAGLWRKKCIEASGGWNGNVLTEDLELSYRAQLAGWKFVYDNEITVPAELPSSMPAFKSQQFRWAKGMAQTAAKHMKQVLANDVSRIKKLHAVLHLLGSLSFVAIMGNILLTIPIVAFRRYLPAFAPLTDAILATGITLPLVCVYYYFGTASTLERRIFWRYLPMFLMIYMALSVQNCVAVVQGLRGHISPFVRTPKTRGKPISGVAYSNLQWSGMNTFELTVAIYLFAGIVLSIAWHDYLLLMFLMMVETGLLMLLRDSLVGLFVRKNERTLLAEVRS